LVIAPASDWLDALRANHRECATETTAATIAITTADTASERAMSVKKPQILFRLYKRSIKTGLRSDRRLAKCRVTIRRCGSCKRAMPKRIIENPTNIPAVQSSSHGNTQKTLMTNGVSI
jgi:hypothetical protein